MNYKKFKKYVDEMNKNISIKLKDNAEELAFYTELVKRFNEICKENEELKKQLEELREQTIIDTLDLQTHKYQQQEFIKYLEKEKDRLASEFSGIYEDDLGTTRFVNEDIFDEVDKNLQKYKEIIGVSDEKEN